MNSVEENEEGEHRWEFGSWEHDILALLVSWRKDTVFRQAFRAEIAKRVTDPDAHERRQRAATKSGRKGEGETRLQHRTNVVFRLLAGQGLIERAATEVKIVDRDGIRAILAAGHFIIPARESNA